MEPPPRSQHLSQRQHTSDTQFHSLGQSRSQRVFASPEELLRYDAAETTPPAGIEPRLRDSIRAEPAPRRSWWARWFGRASD
jgi:hypothetical protein